VNPNPLTLLPARVRLGVYVGYGCLSLTGSAALAYYAAIPALAVPDWLTGVMAALGALAAPIGVLAATNTRDPGDAANSV
jgi:hypothetical protein